MAWSWISRVPLPPVGNLRLGSACRKSAEDGAGGRCRRLACRGVQRQHPMYSRRATGLDARFHLRYAMETAGTYRSVVFARTLDRCDQPFAVEGWAEAEPEQVQSRP